jgi:predicted secreted hydrolase
MKWNKKIKNLSLFILILNSLFLSAVNDSSADTAAKSTVMNASTSSGDTNTGRAGEIFNFPEDHLLHQPQSVVKNITDYTEWLYWTGILRDVKTGDLYGFQYTLFHQNLMPGVIGFVNHVAISDVLNSQHPRNRYFMLPNQSQIINGTDGKKGDYWRYQDDQTTLTYWKNLDAWSIVSHGNVSSDGGHGQNVSINLTLLNDTADYYLEWPEGIGSMGACAEINSQSLVGRSNYYSHPKMNTTGTLTIDGRTVQVSGDSWFDHQWGGYDQCYPAWDWFSLRLDDGSFVMLFNFKDPSLNNLPDQRSLTFIDPEGNVKWWSGEDAANLTITRWWRSDLFNFSYPVEWTLSTPIGNYSLEPYFDEQIMNVDEGEPKYWEGIMQVREEDPSGKQIGMAYMELAGYAPILSQTEE